MPEWVINMMIMMVSYIKRNKNRDIKSLLFDQYEHGGIERIEELVYQLHRLITPVELSHLLETFLCSLPCDRLQLNYVVHATPLNLVDEFMMIFNNHENKFDIFIHRIEIVTFLAVSSAGIHHVVCLANVLCDNGMQFVNPIPEDGYGCSLIFYNAFSMALKDAIEKVISSMITITDPLYIEDSDEYSDEYSDELSVCYSDYGGIGTDCLSPECICICQNKCCLEGRCVLNLGECPHCNNWSDDCGEDVHWCEIKRDPLCRSPTCDAKWSNTYQNLDTNDLLLHHQNMVNKGMARIRAREKQSPSKGKG